MVAACLTWSWAGAALAAAPLASSGSGDADRQAATGATPDEGVLVPALKAVGLAPDEARALAPRSDSGDTLDGVRVNGYETATAEGLKAAVEPFIGRPISKAMLERLRAAIETTPTGETGRVFVARFPRQSIAGGRIALVVTVQRDPQAELLRGSDAGGGPAGVVPILRTGAPGRGPHFFLGLDNQLSRALGDERVYVGARLDDVFDPRSTLGLLLMATPDPDVYRGGSLNHGFRFSDRWRLDVGASASEVDYTEGATTSRRTLVKFEPVATRRFALGGQAWHEARLGLEWRADHAEVTRGGQSRTFELPGLLIQPGWAASLSDRFGRTRLDLGLNCNTGWRGETSDYRAYGSRDARYAALRAEATRVTKLGAWGQWVARGTVQFADQDIPSLDHFYGSGQAGVRGYDENRYHGADAWFVSTEHQGPRFPLPAKCSWQPVWFVDAAGFPGGQTDDTIVGIGVGLRVRVGEGFTLRVDAARAAGERSARDEAGVVHFSTSLRW